MTTSKSQSNIWPPSSKVLPLKQWQISLPWFRALVSGTIYFFLNHNQLIQVDGLIVDARSMSFEIQEEAFRRGLIPYLPTK
jgi:hypothetical protein